VKSQAELVKLTLGDMGKLAVGTANLASKLAAWRKLVSTSDIASVVGKTDPWVNDMVRIANMGLGSDVAMGADLTGVYAIAKCVERKAIALDAGKSLLWDDGKARKAGDIVESLRGLGLSRAGLPLPVSPVVSQAVGANTDDKGGMLAAVLQSVGKLATVADCDAVMAALELRKGAIAARARKAARKAAQTVAVPAQGVTVPAQGVTA
jgi:hypothetical protein